MIPFYIWIGVAVLLFILELLITSSFALLCFSFGAIVAGLISLAGFGTKVELIVFAAFSLLAFLFIRPYLIHLLNKRSEGRPKTNAEGLIGRTGRVVEPIQGKTKLGRIAIDGDIWQAMAGDDSVFEEGCQVIITAVDSIILTVKKKE